MIELELIVNTRLRVIFTIFSSNYALCIFDDLRIGNLCSYLETINNVGNKKSSDFA